MAILRRNLLIVAASFASFQNAYSSTTDRIEIDGAGVKDVRGLVAKMRQAAGSRLPLNLKADVFYRAIVQAAIDNAHRATELNIKVPRAILDRLPSRHVGWTYQRVQAPVFVIFELLGLTFAVPMATFFSIVIGSMWLLSLYLGGHGKKEEPPESEKKPSTFLQPNSSGRVYSI